MKALFDYNRYVTRSTNPGAKRRFHLVMIKPSHYDDDGYVIQWLRSAIPSNTLAALNGLAEDCARRKVMGDDVDLTSESPSGGGADVAHEQLHLTCV